MQLIKVNKNLIGDFESVYKLQDLIDEYNQTKQLLIEILPSDRYGEQYYSHNKKWIYCKLYTNENRIFTIHVGDLVAFSIITSNGFEEFEPTLQDRLRMVEIYNKNK